MTNCRVCNEKESFKFGICKDCIESMPFTNDKINIFNFKKLFVMKCEEHGKYLATSVNPNTCPLCIIYIKCANPNCNNKLNFHKSKTKYLTGEETCSRRCSNFARAERNRLYGGKCKSSLCKDPHKEWDALSAFGQCSNCASRVSSKGAAKVGKANAERIGSKGYCSRENCPNKGELITITNISGMCPDCSLQNSIDHRVNLGQLNKEKIGKINYCSSSNCKNKGNKVKIINANGMCKECSSKHVNKMQSFIINYGHGELKECKSCEIRTPHSKEGYCRICGSENYNSEYLTTDKHIPCKQIDMMFCEECQCFGLKRVHEDRFHTKFYKSKTREWILRKPEELNSINWNTVDNLYISGIYAFVVDYNDIEYPIYVGQSLDINSRVLDHLYNIFHYPEYFAYDKEIGIRFKVLEECEKELLIERESYWIKTLKPWSQKDRSDNILDLNKRISLPFVKPAY